MAQQISRLFDILDHQLATAPQANALGYRHEGKTTFFSTQLIKEMADKVSMGLLSLGFKKGDTIASVIHKNRPEWCILDIGMNQIGVVHVPVYPTISAGEYEYIFNDAAVKYCFIGDDASKSIHKRVTTAQANVPTLTEVFTFDHTEGVRYWEEIFSTEGQEALLSTRNGVDAQDLATLIYTSGTTGQPKGVMLSHDNILSNVFVVEKIVPLIPGETALSFLPLNHIFEKTCSYVMLWKCASVVFTGTDNLGGETGDLANVRPHFFTSVPRLLEKVYERIYNKGLDLKGIKRSLFFWALEMTNHYDFDKKYSGLEGIKFRIADKLIFSKWRAALGGNLKGIAVGASACPLKIVRTFSAAGIPIREAYGMTETSPGITGNEFVASKAKMGTVGRPFEGCDVRIDTSDGNYREGEGEILCAGRNVMMGYYKQPEKTAEVIKIIDGKRFMCTGDIGRWIEYNGEKYLQITDRKKELFKTSGGKYVAPSPIESKLKDSYLIEQAMVVGENEKFVSAIISPSVDALKNYCNENGIEFTNLKTVLKDKRVLKKYEEVIEKYNPNFSKVEQVKKFILVPDAWEPTKTDGSQAELTPTMKLKRRVILDKYAQLIKDVYSQHAVDTGE